MRRTIGKLRGGFPNAMNRGWGPDCACRCHPTSYPSSTYALSCAPAHWVCLVRSTSRAISAREPIGLSRQHTEIGDAAACADFPSPAFGRSQDVLEQRIHTNYPARPLAATKRPLAQRRGGAEISRLTPGFSTLRPYASARDITLWVFCIYVACLRKFAQENKILTGSNTNLPGVFLPLDSCDSVRQ
jgi:hypothetical protein